MMSDPLRPLEGVLDKVNERLDRLEGMMGNPSSDGSVWHILNVLRDMIRYCMKDIRMRVEALESREDIDSEHDKAFDEGVMTASTREMRAFAKQVTDTMLVLSGNVNMHGDRLNELCEALRKLTELAKSFEDKLSVTKSRLDRLELHTGLAGMK